AFGTLLGANLAIIQASLFATPALAQFYSNPGTSTYDPSLRALQYYTYKRVAESGPERGRELYYFKCWQCHNEFQKTAPQLQGLKSNITTTVYTDENGRFEFPKLLAGSYLLRIVRALEFKPYLKPSVQLDGTSAKLDDIILEPVSNGEFVPANWDIAAQLA